MEQDRHTVVKKTGKRTKEWRKSYTKETVRRRPPKKNQEKKPYQR
jgi:hypothetical protein